MENIDSTKIKHQLEVTLILNIRVVEPSAKRQTRSLFPDYRTRTELEKNMTGEAIIHHQMGVSMQALLNSRTQLSGKNSLP